MLKMSVGGEEFAYSDRKRRLVSCHRRVKVELCDWCFISRLVSQLERISYVLTYNNLVPVEVKGEVILDESVIADVKVVFDIKNDL